MGQKYLIFTQVKFFLSWKSKSIKHGFEPQNVSNYLTTAQLRFEHFFFQSKVRQLDRFKIQIFAAVKGQPIESISIISIAKFGQVYRKWLETGRLADRKNGIEWNFETSRDSCMNAH